MLIYIYIYCVTSLVSKFCDVHRKVSFSMSARPPLIVANAIIISLETISPARVLEDKSRRRWGVEGIECYRLAIAPYSCHIGVVTGHTVYLHTRATRSVHTYNA